MPRKAGISHPALRAIADDQRYTPAHAALRIVERIERLAQEIEAGASYPRDYIVFRMTEYRADGTAIELIPGDALLADLSALAESIASHAHMPGDPAQDVLTLDDLRERWGVSRSTIERDRRRGLIARRIRDDDGAERLVFARQVVEAFEREHPERTPDGAQRPARLTGEERDLILRRAPRYEEALGMSVHAIAGRLGARMGRSVNAVRAVIESRRDAQPSVDERAAHLMLRAWERGIPVTTLAERTARSRTTVHRLLLAQRLERVRSAGAPGPSDHADAEAGALDHPVAQAGLLVPAPDDVPGVLALAGLMSEDTEQQERARALAARAAWRRASTLARTMTDGAPPPHLVDRAETDLRWAGLLRERVVWGVLPMAVRTIEERADQHLSEMPPALVLRLIEGALAQVGEGARDFDASRGGRLAGRTTLRVDRFVVHALQARREARERGSATRRVRITTGAWRALTRHAHPALEPPAWLLANLLHLDEPARDLVCHRFGLTGERPRTVLELGESIGHSPRAVWAALHRAARDARA